MRVGNYYRVSSEDQVDGYSIDAQRRACREFVSAKGFALVDEYVEEGKSARSDAIDKRPEFRRMLADVDAGRLEAVVVHKQDRFARNQLVLYSSLQRLDRAGVRFYTAAEDIDYTTSTGRLTLGVKGSVAEWYSNNLSEETRKGKRERKAQGQYNGLLPFGATKGPDNLAVPDREQREELGGRSNYDGLLMMLHLAAQGSPDRAIAETLNEAGYRTTGNRGGGLFSKDTVRRILTNRFYLGELPVGRRQDWVEGAHKPFWQDFPVELWRQAQTARQRNMRTAASASVPKTCNTYSLSGLVSCGECGGPMHVIWQGKKKGKPRMYCYNTRQGKARCPGGSGALDFYEAQIERYLSDLMIPDDYVEALLDAHANQNGQTDTASERSKLEARIDRINDQYEMGGITKGQYAAKLKELRSQLADIEVPTDRKEHLRRLGEHLRDIPAAWSSASQVQRNKLLRVVFDGLKGIGPRLVACKPRADLLCFWQLHHSPSKGMVRGGTDGDRISTFTYPEW